MTYKGESNMISWEETEKNIKASPKKIAVLPHSRAAYADIRGNFRLKEDTTLSEIFKNCGGLVVNDMLRIYGAGELNFTAINNEFPEFGTLVGEDIFGGLFVLLDNGNIGYFSPDNLLLEDTELDYDKFLTWVISGDTELLYRPHMWEGFESYIKNLSLTEGILFSPYLWKKSKSPRTKKKAPMSRIIELELKAHKNAENTDVD